VIQFILNQSLVQLKTIQADTTLLDYLRLQANLKGSKEGCASGDCGACTVVIASPNQQGNSLEYKTLNSCICLLGSLHGKQVITVDGLKDKSGKLHPVQQAMVDHHASQCGFCTPGFVMSIFAMYKQKKGQGLNLNQGLAFSHDDIINHLDGNLCRCTGYRPIIDAAHSVLKNADSDNFDKYENEEKKVLTCLNTIQKAQNNYFFIPQTINELTDTIANHPTVKLLAGGTDLALGITQGLQKLEKIVYLGNVAELKALSINENEVVIGSAVTYEGCAKALINEYPILETHLNRLGSLQIRNVATIGGNIANASPIGDMPPVLLALNAQLTLQKGSKKRKVSMDDFYIGYKQTILQAGEFIRDIHIPRSQANHYLTVYKITKRHADDISAICSAFYLHINKGKIVAVRITFGGMAATVIRAFECEKAMINQPLNDLTLESAKVAILKDINPLSDVRSSREYRLKMAENTLQRLFLEQRHHVV